MELIDNICKTLGISEKMLFPERYMNDEEKQEYIEGCIKFIKNIFEEASSIEEGEYIRIFFKFIIGQC